MIGLAPLLLLRGDPSVFSRSTGVFLSANGVVLTVAWLAGDADFRPTGVRFPDDFFSAWLLSLALTLSWPLTLWTLAFDAGLLSSVDFFETTLVSYGLNASDFPSDGLLRVLRSNFAAGGDFAFAPPFMLFGVLSRGEIKGFVGESAPIWLHVCANKANGLFFASNCKVKRKYEKDIREIRSNCF